jgi:hypothetical protein
MRAQRLGKPTRVRTTVFLSLLVALLAACQEGTHRHSLAGYAINGPLDAATVEILTTDGVPLATVATRRDGRFEAALPAAPPYRLQVSGGTSAGFPYEGVLESWCVASECHATPWSTVLVRLMEQHGFNVGDALALLASVAGFDDDPFVREVLTGQIVPAQEFDLAVVRLELGQGTRLAAWVDGVVGWLTGDDCRFPGSLGFSSAPDCGAPPEEDFARSPGWGEEDDIGLEVFEIASAIVRYLAVRPDAFGTAQDILRWWLYGTLDERSLDLVERALDHLEQSGCVIRFAHTGGLPLYRKGMCEASPSVSAHGGS